MQKSQLVFMQGLLVKLAIKVLKLQLTFNVLPLVQSYMSLNKMKIVFAAKCHCVLYDKQTPKSNPQKTKLLLNHLPANNQFKPSPFTNKLPF